MRAAGDSLASALYPGVVSHLRVKPRRHALRYRIFQVLLDLDELPALDRSLRLFSRGRFNLFSFHDRDHGAGDGALRPYVQAVLSEAGIAWDGGAVRLLCMPRVLGYVFNPISLYFCHQRSGDLAAILYEVNNTFGQRHSYLYGVEAGVVRPHGCAKAFYVSPFLDLDMSYAFEVRPPGERVATVVRASDAEGLVISASFAAERRTLSDRAILAAFFGHPLLTLKVVAGIHWEAARLFAKGVRLTRRPPPPPAPVTVAG